MSEKKWTTKRILRHILFWATYYLMNIAVYGHLYDDYVMIFIGDLKVLPLKISLSYITIYYLIPEYILKDGKYALFFVYFIFTSIVIITISNFFIYYEVPKYDFYDPYVIMKYALSTYPVVGLVVAVKYWTYWYHGQLQQEKLKKEKFEAELKMLRSQIHPHFLFNTINNIYALALERSDKTPGALLKLSEILNYVLYECNADNVPLTKEIELLKNYLSLEKIRYEDRLDVLFKISGNTSDVMIAPLILLTFTENCFKHGVGKMTDGAWVSVDISAENDSIIVKIENSKNEELSYADDEIKKKENSYSNGGIGLKNVERRLNLIYGDQARLEIHDSKNSFLVHLEITQLLTERIRTS